MVPNQWTQIGTWTSWSTAASISTPISYDPWQWTGMSTSATTIQYNAPWEWNVSSPVVEYIGWENWNTAYQETEDQKQARLEAVERARITRERERAEFRERQLRRAEEIEKANARAKELLMSMLSAKQKRDILEHKWFEVIGKSGRRWRIRTEAGVSGNVDLMPMDPNDNQRLVSYCAHGQYTNDGAMPEFDHFLLQKLVLESDDSVFTKVAYQHWIRPDIAEAERDLIPARGVGLRPVA